MTNSTSNRSPREQQLDAIIAEYYQAAEQGQAPAQAKFLAQHSDFSAELREFFADDGRLRSVARSFNAHETRTVAAVGHQIRDYRILNKIGAGGMGTVYLALHMRLEKTVALKILKADRERDANAIARFEREWKAVGKLKHPHIVEALDAGEEAGTHFLAMEYLDGCDLGHLLKTKGRLELPLACELIRQAALGLQYAHDHNLVHRDVKPSNLMLSSAGQVKVLDLGLAQLQVKVDDTQELTREGQLVGTWLYMAPEQFLPGRQVDSRSDIFSLGVTFYSFLVGELPLGRGQVASQLPAIGTQRADVPRELQELLGKMLAPNQDERIQTMTEVATVLQAYTSQDPVNILANDASRYERKIDLPNSIDATQRFSTTAHDVEVIPPPLPVQPPPVPSLGAPVKAWLLKYWRQVSLVGVAAAMLMMAVVVKNLPGDGKPTPPPGPGIPIPPRVNEEGHLNLVPGIAGPNLPPIYAVPKGEKEDPVLLKPGSNPLPPGSYCLYPDHPDWLLTPEEVVVGIGTTQPVTAKQLPHVAWLYPRLPEQAGAYLEGRGTLWLKGMPDEGLPYVLTLTMREPEVFADDVGAKVPCNWLEVKVIQGDYTETGRLLVDTNEYRSSNNLKVMKGWLTATSSDIKKRLKYLRLPQKNPPLQLAVGFDKSTDAIRDRAKELEIKIPLMRVSVQDALIMLFGADFYSSSETLRGVRARLANDRGQPGSRELVTGGPKGDLCCWVVKSEEVKKEDDKSTSYSYYRHEAVPFSVVKIEAKVPDSFRATFTHTAYGTGRAPEATLTPEDLQVGRDLKRDLVNFDESSLPLAEGAKAKYRLTVTRGGKDQVFEVSLRMADAWQAGMPNRWLEIDVNSKTDKEEFREQALLSIEDLRDKKGALTVKNGFILNQKEVFLFEPGGDRESLDLGLLKLGKKPTTSMLTVHDVLALMFNAELEASREIGGLRTKVAGLPEERKFLFVDIVLRDLRMIPGEEWVRPRGPGLPPVYRFTRSRELPFDFNTIDFTLTGVFVLHCELAENTNEMAPSLLGYTKQELEVITLRTKSRIEAAEPNLNWREWRSTTPGGWREWAEFAGQLKDGTVLLKCKRESTLETTSVSFQSLRQEDKDWIAEGRYWNAPALRGFPMRATFVKRGALTVELKPKTGPKSFPKFDELSVPDQEWVKELDARLK